MLPRLSLLALAAAAQAQTVHTFDGASGSAVYSNALSSNGDLTLVTAFRAEYLIVGGGGGGGGGAYAPGTGGGGGGGGGGAVVTGAHSIAAASYQVAVGAGGLAGGKAAGGSWNGVTGGAGGASSVFGLSAAGGAGGYGGALNDSGWTDDAAALRGGVSGAGLAGGVRGGSNGWDDGAPGGGGASAAGGNGNGRTAGGGGAGLASSLGGAAVTYGGGGAGGTNWMGTSALGGSGGGGASHASGTDGLGGGGGGGFGADAFQWVGNGGAGGSGTVLVRYRGAQAASGGAIAAGAGAAAGYTVHTFSSVGAASLDFAGLDLASRVRAEHTGVISGTGNVFSSTPGVLRLSGANTYTGGTGVASGVLEFSTVADGAASNLGAGSGALGYIGLVNATLRYVGTGSASSTRHLWVDLGDGVIDVSQSTGHLTLNPGGGLISRHFRKEGAGHLTLGLGLASTASLTVAAGTLELTGASTNTGATTVSGGTLIVNGSTSSQSVVSVASGATLGGSGTLGGATTVAGTHSPGNSPGVQTFTGDLTYASGASVVWELAANTESNSPLAFDQVVVGGDLSFTGSTALQIVLDWAGSTVDWDDAFWAANRSWVLFDVAGSTGGFGNLQVANAAYLDASGALLGEVRQGASFFLSQDGSDIRINYVAPVPEPSTYGLMLGALALVSAAARRRRARRA